MSDSDIKVHLGVLKTTVTLGRKKHRDPKSWNEVTTQLGQSFRRIVVGIPRLLAEIIGKATDVVCAVGQAPEERPTEPASESEADLMNLFVRILRTSPNAEVLVRLRDGGWEVLIRPRESIPEELRITPLESIVGGPTLVDLLKLHGYASLGSLAGTSPQDLMAIPGVSAVDSERVLAAFQDFLSRIPKSA